MTKFEAWIEAMRLRTLPLSVSGIIAGSGMAAILEKWNPLIFGLAMLTTIGFQVLSNLANDLGVSSKTRLKVILTVFNSISPASFLYSSFCLIFGNSSSSTNNRLL